MAQTETKVDLTIVQRPVYVSFECPECDYDNDIPFDEFNAAHGDIPDWQYETVTCSHCGKKFPIDNIEWD